MELSTDVKEIINEAGVADLPFKVKAYFSRALKCERMNDEAGARENLDKAILMEESTPVK
jgi:fructose-bisphosphate aldolase class 1